MGQNLDGKIAFYSPRNGRDDIFIMNADGSNVELVTKGKDGGKCPDISPDGTRIVFVSLRDGNSDLYLLDLVSGTEQRLTSLPSVERQPKWSPDGGQITFQSDRDGNYEIHVMDADGTNWQRLTNNEAEELWPNWSPDGRQISFSSNRDGNWEVYVVNTDGSGLRRLTTSDLDETGVSWSPDGTRLAFRSGPARQFQGDIHVMNVDGTHEITLTDFDGVEENPVWSPDGRQIAFQTMKDGNFEIYAMDADGSNLRNLINHPANDYWPSWVSPSSGSHTGKCLPASAVELHILYDNNSHNDRMSPAHGFSCLIEAGNETLLLDAGGDGELLVSNMAAGGYNPQEIDMIAVTHCHADHIGGLPSVMRASQRQAKLFLPCGGSSGNIAGRALSTIDSATNLAGDVIYVETPTSLCAGVTTTGPVGNGIHEEGLIIHTDAGAVLITGCAHPGIERIVHRISELTEEPILLVMGGFHLAAESQEMIDVLATKLEGLVKYIGPCHCSGDLARERFKNRFGNRCLDLGVGSTLKISDLITNNEH
ncbi:MAG: MBL fold metallo-hydrolase [candidate division Zixibacteria bacterium]|jgi:TolB protein|nr:MBL fold metallo-hydrolase [candidate division Zixibacteria bacterium]